MALKDDILTLFKQQAEVLRRALLAAREAQKNAPSAMESHSDTTRSEKEKLVTALESDIAQLAKQLKQLDNFETKVVEVEFKGRTIKCCLVPAGLGGRKIGDIQLVSPDSPLGKSIYV